MSSQHEYEEVMRAAMQFGTTKTVDEVLAEQKDRHDRAERERSSSSKAMAAYTKRNPNQPAAAPVPAQPSTTTALKSEMAKLRALLDGGTKSETLQDFPIQ